VYSSLFISHGAPTLPISGLPARTFLAGLGPALGRPKAIVVVSPHWMTRGRAVKSPPRIATWHDFSGFPAELYTLKYEAPGDAALRARVLDLLGAAGVAAAASEDVKLDHGVWVPLRLMYPQADVPVVQVSATWDTPRHYYDLGRALRPLAQEGVLLIGSGGLVHNLHEIVFDGGGIPGWAQDFHDWCDAQIKAGDWDALCDYRRQAPAPERAHPTEDHLLPLFFAGGAGGAASALHNSFAHGSLSMATYGFA
jgi:4,5-DOPA dioxygenase extradiol